MIRGGEEMSKMSQQEQKLRRVEQEAMQRQQEQLRLARELAEKEEANLQVGYDAYSCVSNVLRSITSCAYSAVSTHSSIFHTNTIYMYVCLYAA